MSEQKTHRPSKRKLEDARRQGRVIRSAVFTQSVVVLFAFLALFIVAALSWVRWAAMLEYTLSAGMKLPAQTAALWAVEVGRFLASVLVTLTITAALLELLQQGFVLRFSLLSFKITRFDPVAGMKRLMQEVSASWSLILSLLFTLALVVYEMQTLFSITFISLAELNPDLEIIAASFFRFIACCLSAVIFCGIFDYFLKRRQFLKEHSMSRDELQREHREDQGDPLLKAQRKALHRAFIMQELVTRVRRSKVVVVSSESK